MIVYHMTFYGTKGYKKEKRRWCGWLNGRWKMQRQWMTDQEDDWMKKWCKTLLPLTQDITGTQESLSLCLTKRHEEWQHATSCSNQSIPWFICEINDWLWQMLRCSTVPKYLGTKKRTLVTRQMGNQARRIRHHESDDSEYSMIIALGMMTEPLRIREKHKAAPRRANSLDQYYFMKVMTNESRCL